MDLGDYLSFVACGVAIFALIYLGRQAHPAKDAAVAAEDQARAVEDQIQLQRDLAKLAAEPSSGPISVATMRPGTCLVLLLENPGAEHRPQCEADVRSRAAIAVGPQAGSRNP